ncbi:MAG TPA: hypothetical protein VHO03_16520 [Ignavibacteriales bacterium]|nr:hypothetical protein [Ignavibacteriales bacterium]
MKAETQVISLELAMKLRDLGVNRRSLFCWEEYEHKKSGERIWDLRSGRDFPGYAGGLQEGARHLDARSYIDYHEENCKAYTSSELGEMLPANKTYTHKDGNKWCCSLGMNFPECPAEFETNEAEARGKLLVHCIVNGIITVEEINNRP